MTKSFSYLTRTEYDQVAQIRALLENGVAVQDLPPIGFQRAVERTAILAALRVPLRVLVASLLIPVIRRELLPEGEIKQRFPAQAVQIAQLTARILYYDPLDAKKRTTLKALHTDKLRRLFAHTYNEPDVALIIAADRMVSLSTLDQMDDAEQQNWAQEIIAVYLPLLEMLGLWDFRRTLGNTSLEIVSPSFYRQLERQVSIYHDRHQSLFRHIHQSVLSLFEEQAIKGAQIAVHDATPISIYQRMERARRRGGKFNTEDVNILVVDIILETVRDCYHTLGLIHNRWRPAHRNAHYADRRFYDYIAAPRFNGYRCLITTVLCEYEQEKPEESTDPHTTARLVEFRIRTVDMEQINTKGYAAAFNAPMAAQNVWWQNKAVRDLVRPGNTDQLKNHTYIGIFTPTGEVITPVRKGCTMVDMAFRIHAHLGPYARRFWVNGKQVGFEYELMHRDLIEIEYDPQFPSIVPEWEQYAVTSVARANIRHFLREMDKSPNKGRQLIDEALERECGIYQMRFSEDRIDVLLTKIAHQYNLPNIDALCVRVLENDISPDEIVTAMIEAELITYVVTESGEPLPANRIQFCRCWMQEREPRKWDRSTRVMPGAPIVGRAMGSDKHAPIIVHRIDCRNAPRDESALPLAWRGTTTPREIAEITITAPPRAYVAGMVLNAVYAVNSEDEQRKLGIHRFNAEMQDGSLFMNLVVDAPTKADLEKLQDGLQAAKRGNYIGDFMMWQLFPGQKLVFAGRSDKRRQNPYTLRQVRDQSMFFGREEEIKQIIECVQQDHTFVVLYGQKRIGKTSLMYQLAENLLPQSCNVLPVLFDSHSISPFSTATFLLGLAEAAMRKLPARLKRWEDRKGLQIRERDLATDPFVRFAAWVKRVEQRLQGTRIIFMIDEFTRAEEECRRGKLDVGFFDGLQYLAGSEDIGIILCVHDSVYHEDSLSWEMFQRGQPIRLRALDRASAARLVKQPLERLYTFDQKIVDEILDLTHCHPYFIQAICQSLITHMAQKADEHITKDDLIRARASVLVTGDHYFSHYRGITDGRSWDTLKILAYITDEDDHLWATSDEIRQGLKKFGHNIEGWAIAKSIGDLLHAGIIEARDVQSQHAAYRIPIGMLRLWLRQVVTHPIISRDIQRKEF